MKTAELVTFPAKSASPLPTAGRRLLIYVVYDVRGDVEEYIPYALERLRLHCSHVLVVVNGVLTETGRARLEPVSDEILVRENRGFDIWGYKEGLDAVGERIADYDEVLLANDTWFGPIRPFAPVFERMDRRALHFWGMTDHLRVEPHPFTNTGYLPYHLQSYWLGVRRDMFLSDEWRDYWRDLPAMSSYSDAVVKHEGIFTEHFTDRGFIGEVAFPTLTDKVENHAVLYAEQLIQAGCPTLKRRPFFQWPPYLDHLAVVGRWTLDTVERSGYPMELIYADLARNVEPRTLNADAAMLEVLPEADVSYDPEAPLRTLVVAHVFYPEMTDEILDRVDVLPGEFDLVITTPDDDRAQAIEQVLLARPARGATEVRVVASNNGRDQSAFLIGCRDLLLSDQYDLVVKVHSKKTPQDSPNVGRHFKRQQFTNLLNSPGYAANLVALFQREPGLGLVFPPTIHLGYPSMGHGWWANKPAFVELADALGIRVPADEISPLAPFGSMFAARPAALRILVEREWTYDDFGGVEAYQDGGLAHVLERLPVYAAGELGFHTRTVANAEYLASSYAALDYNLDQLSSTLPDSTMQQIQLLRQAGPIEYGTLRDFARMYARLHRPHDEARLVAVADKLLAARARLRRVRRLLPGRHAR
ncbi:rhamnan synthesis F family protein [Microbacterium sp. AZCO]|uniref:rhamnan synthesis F family protein n=1 Tax=Microbacterium sp. AZCO TaxID=3142976 RepID=UPI0031F43F41